MIPDYLPGQEWPPPDQRRAQRYYREAGAWWSGDPEELQTVYGGMKLDVEASTSTFERSGLSGLIHRFWWGRSIEPEQGTPHLHVPIAADIATASADLLYSEMPSLVIPAEGEDGVQSEAEAKVQAALDKIVDESGLAMALPESAELGSAFGGRFIGARVDIDVLPDAPMFYSLSPRHAVPEWRYGRLVAVTFWREVPGLAGTKSIHRHLERHEVVGGVGMIYHALYIGNAGALGRLGTLYDSPETQRLAKLVDANGGIKTGATMLDVAYVPNIKPHRLMPESALGRPDTAGAEGAMDGLDETYSSGQRDIQNGKGRVMVPPEYLQSLGQGKGARFDIERQVFTRLRIMAPEGGYVKPEVVQFQIRVAEHEAWMATHLRTIMRSAGLSMDTFGDTASGGVMTAKEVGKRGERTTATRGKKIAYETYALRNLLFVALEMAKNLIGGRLYSGIVPIRPDVEFPDAAAPDPQSFATTIKLLKDAKALSTQIAVEMLHPEWDAERVRAEVDRIEKPAANPDQFDQGAFGGRGPGGDELDESELDPDAEKVPVA